MAKLAIPQTFASIAQLRSVTGHVLPTPHEWRLLSEQVIGAIRGIPTMRGTAVATNGIHVLIMRHDGVVFGHMDFFVPDERENVKIITAALVKKPARATKEVDVSEFI